MNRDNVIKALEWCIQSESCEYCSYKDDVDVCSIKSDALALIKELTEEVESWKKECASRTTVYCELHSKCEKLTEENEKLGIENFDLICELSRIKENTVREFAERFHEIMGGKFSTCNYCGNDGYWSVKEVKGCIDQITKEILNENTEVDLK